MVSGGFVEGTGSMQNSGKTVPEKAMPSPLPLHRGSFRITKVDLKRHTFGWLSGLV